MAAETKIFTITEIFKDSFKKLFSTNFWPLCGYIIWQILLQVLGIVIAIFPAFLVSLLGSSGAGIAFSLVLVVSGAVLGILIFCRAFWTYIVRTAALCAISKELINSGHLPNLKQAEEQIRSRSTTYIKLLLWIALICIILLTPVIIILVPFSFLLAKAPSVVQFIVTTPFTFMFTLIGVTLPFLFLPAFVLNSNFKAMDAIKRSFDLAKNHAGETLTFLSLVSIICMLLNFACSVRFIGFFIILPVTVITALLLPILTTHWYLRLEAGEAVQAI